jgi:pimeloyl-ACP methyl ester carboxylesterase
MGRSDSSLVLVEGPWEHRMVAANGNRFHVAEAGEGPMVVLLHGFPQFWWAWRRMLPALADAGFRAVAMDLRGYGQSDKPPRGYDPFTLSADVAGVVRSLGARDAAVVGHGLGGFVAWAMGVLTPDVVRRVAVLSSPHPRRLRAAVTRSPRQLRASARGLPYQLPLIPEARLTRDEGLVVTTMLHDWSAQPWLDDDTAQRFAEAMCIPTVAHCALEFYRWAFRSLPRPDGLRFGARMKDPVRVPVLQLHGAADPVVLPRSAAGSDRYVAAPYRSLLLDGVGHFPHEEAHDLVAKELDAWLAEGETQAPGSP